MRKPSPEGQFGELIEVFCSGDTLTFDWQFKPLNYVQDGIWELKTADLRIFGWFPEKDCFIGVIADTKQRILDYKLVTPYADVEVATFRKNLDLDEPKFLDGKDPHAVVTDYDTPDKRAAARFIGSVRRAIQKAYIEEQRKRGVSQSGIARALKVHRSVINRELRGMKDMTLGRVGQFAWALGRKPKFNLDEQIVAIGQNTPPPAPPKIQPKVTSTGGTLTPQKVFAGARAT